MPEFKSKEVRLPPTLVIRKLDTEIAFKKMFFELFSKNSVKPSLVIELNKLLRKWLFIGMKNVDMKDAANKEAFDQLADDMWKIFYRFLLMHLRRNSSNMIRKI